MQKQMLITRQYVDESIPQSVDRIGSDTCRRFRIIVRNFLPRTTSRNTQSNVTN